MRTTRALSSKTPTRDSNAGPFQSLSVLTSGFSVPTNMNGGGFLDDLRSLEEFVHKNHEYCAHITGKAPPVAPAPPCKSGWVRLRSFLKRLFTSVGREGCAQGICD